MTHKTGHRWLIVGICVVFIGAKLLWAQEPWKNKSWMEWTKDEVQSVLTASPWAQRLTIKDNLKGSYVVQWASSVTVRQAWIRELQLREPNVKLDTDKILSERQDYEIHMLPFSKGSFSDDPLEDIPCGPPTFIQFGNGPKVQTHQVGLHGGRVEFFFRRQVDNQPLFTQKEEKVLFQCGSVKLTFDLRKMLREGKPDL